LRTAVTLPSDDAHATFFFFTTNCTRAAVLVFSAKRYAFAILAKRTIFCVLVAVVAGVATGFVLAAGMLAAELPRFACPDALPVRTNLAVLFVAVVVAFAARRLFAGASTTNLIKSAIGYALALEAHLALAGVAFGVSGAARQWLTRVVFAALVAVADAYAFVVGISQRGNRAVVAYLAGAAV
jgi:hypothetical protein